MDCVKQLPMWAQPVLAVPSFGAAQFTAASGSTIELTSRLPNIFGNDGDYIDFMFFQSSASAWTVFGSTVSPDAIILNDNTITITDGTTSDSITLLASLSTTEWNHIRLIRNGSTIECYVATGGDSLVLELQTLDVIPLDLDIIGKNQAALSHVYAATMNGAEGDYFSKSSPSTAVQGTDAGFSRAGAVNLSEAGNYCLMDCLSGNDGWRVEIENVYLHAHRLKWTVGNGTTTVTKESTEVFYPEEWVYWYVDLEDLGETTPGGSDTTIEGFSPHTSNFYIGSQGGTTNYFSGKMQSFLCMSSILDSTDLDWLFNDGTFRALDEIGASTQVATGDVTNGWPLSEASGTREDIFGTDDLTEVPGYAYSPTKNNGGFETWNSTTDLDGFTELLNGTSTINQESSTVHGGTYAVRVDVDASSNTATIRDTNYKFTTGRDYNFSIWAAVSGNAGSARFRIFQATNFYNFTFSSTSYTEYTQTFTAEESATAFQLLTVDNLASQSVYFDDMTIQADTIGRVLGLRTSYLTAASFTGYLRNVMVNAAAGYLHFPLTANANDLGGDENNGTASNVTFVTVDPA